MATRQCDSCFQGNGRCLENTNWDGCPDWSNCCGASTKQEFRWLKRRLPAPELLQKLGHESWRSM